MVIQNGIVIEKQYTIYNMKQDIINSNNKGQQHGYQEWYYNDEIMLRANYKNDFAIGYS